MGEKIIDKNKIRKILIWFIFSCLYIVIAILIYDLYIETIVDYVLIHPNAFAPAWSPDGSQLVISSNRGKYREIYTVNPDGSNLELVASLKEPVKVITHFPRDYRSFNLDTYWIGKATDMGNISIAIIPLERKVSLCWSEDDLNWIQTQKQENEIYSCDISYSNLIGSPNNKLIARYLSRDEGIVISDFNGGNRIQIPIKSPGYLTWSSDEKHLAIEGSDHETLYLYTFETNKLLPIIETKDFIYQFEWSPSGNLLAVVIIDEEATGKIIFFDPTNINSKEIIFPEVEDFYLDWSPDEQYFF